MAAQKRDAGAASLFALLFHILGYSCKSRAKGQPLSSTAADSYPDPDTNQAAFLYNFSFLQRSYEKEPYW
ncbi:hypothetical protein [Paenibacillus sp. GM2FR]|uniref:hypothetical protein n=1 Tax=Paenibacillus sp. GM2FR TaxID=2059268 RepID=UPI0010563C2C|nr:hypothetical protein [Paenibacillus sp. GM2FR]